MRAINLRSSICQNTKPKKTCPGLLSLSNNGYETNESEMLQNIIGQDNDMRAKCAYLRVTRTGVKKFNWRTIGGRSGQEEEWQDLSSSNVDLSSSWRCWIHLSCQTAFTSLQNILLNELIRLKLFLLGWIADIDLTKVFMAATLKVSRVDTLQPFPPLEGTEMKIQYIDCFRFSQMSWSQTKQCEQDTWTLFPTDCHQVVVGRNCQILLA